MSGTELYLEGEWVAGHGDYLTSLDPASGEPVWQGHAADAAQVDAAVGAARSALPTWSDLGFQARWQILQAFADELERSRDELTEVICHEVGKPRWEGLAEVGAMVAKVAVTRDAYDQRVGPREQDLGGSLALLRARPLGVLAVLGPFNLPGHLPNGHIVPALLAGNAVVFKPSEYSPGTAVAMVGCWERAGLPPGVLNLVQGDGRVGRILSAHDGLDGLLFTGSYAAGVSIHRQFGGCPEKLLALEMGGNNPLLVWESGNPVAAARLAVLSAYITSGQRCTCARRLILPAGREGDDVVQCLRQELGALRVGSWDAEPPPFMGPLISGRAAARLLQVQTELLEAGGVSLVRMEHTGGSDAFLTPGLIDVTGLDDPGDEEWFGPLLQILRVDTFEAALRAANATRYGLAAGLVSSRRELFERFAAVARAGVLAWNRPTTGASNRLPFGGVGRSGNHRPSGYWAVDSCADPVASLEVEEVAVPRDAPPGLGEFPDEGGT